MDQIGSALDRANIHRPPLEAQRTCETHGAYTAKCYLGDVWTKCPTCADVEKAREENAQKDRDAAAALDRWNKSVEGAGIPERFRDRRFKNYAAETQQQENALNIAKQYAKEWEAVRGNGRSMVFLGPPGTGKTHLACAIAMHVMHKHHASVMFKTVAQAVRGVKDTWAKGADKSESQAIAELTSPQLLVLDEVGIQTGSEWEKNVLFDILNERYLKRRPTIMLTNLSEEELPKYLGERVLDRMREDDGLIVPFLWASHRGKLVNTREST